MTTRHKGYMIALADDVRDDDAEAIIMALKMVRGALAVTPIDADPSGDWIVEERVRRDLHAKILEIAYPKIRRDR